VGQSATLNGRRSGATRDELLNAALGRAVASPRGLALVGRGGMFPASASGREAAKLAQELGFVRPLTEAMNGKQTAQLWTISDPGRAHWLKQSDPTQTVQALTNGIEACQHELAQLGKRADGCRDYLSRLSCAVENAFKNSKPPVQAVREGSATEPAKAILECLRAWCDAGDCPLPVLLKKVTVGRPDISLGAFHDALRSLQESGQIHLHPWTGPLYELPDPTVALLTGHEVAYYASARVSDHMARLPPGEGSG
jgi:hypothetical protein